MNLATKVSEWLEIKYYPERLADILSISPPSAGNVLISSEGDSGMLARDSGLCELYSGNTRVVLDGKQGYSLSMAQTSIALVSQEIRLMASNYRLGKGDINRSLLTTDPSIMKPGPAFIPDIQIITGTPLEGQIPMSLSDLIDTEVFLTEPSTRVGRDAWIQEALKRTGEVLDE